VGIGDWISEIWHKDISVEISAAMNSLIASVFTMGLGGFCLFYSVMWFVHVGIERVRKAKRASNDHWRHSFLTWIGIGAAFIGFSLMFLMGAIFVLSGGFWLFEIL
jgi:hypothetical protein